MTISTLLAGGAAVLVFALGASLLLPRHVHVERQSTIKTSPDAILTLASSTDGYQRFNPYRTADADLKISGFGPDRGVGAGFRFEGKDGKGSQTIAAISDTAIRYEIDLGAMGQPVQQITAQPTADGTLVTWSMDMDMGFNPIGRIMGLFMDKMVGKTFEQGLTNLAQAT